MAPRARVCYICGRQYMLHSFDIHISQCRDLFEKRENLKPPKERRKCPDDPSANIFNHEKQGGRSISTKELDSLNSAAMDTWNTESLLQCKNCNRSFLPDKLKIHNKSCTSSNPARRVDESVNRRVNTGTYDISQYNDYATNMDYDNGNLNQCKVCGRKFNSVSFQKYDYRAYYR